VNRGCQRHGEKLREFDYDVNLMLADKRGRERPAQYGHFTSTGFSATS